MARTLLESTLKTILDDREVAYEQDAGLPQLYKAVAKELNLSAGEHTEQAFKHATLAVNLAGSMALFLIETTKQAGANDYLNSVLPSASPRVSSQIS